MKAAVVQGAGQAPVYTDFESPAPGPAQLRVRVSAAALTPLARARAAGAHYSATSAYPFVAGVDGVGRLSDGSRVYFFLPSAPHGAFAEETLVSAQGCVPLPEDLDDATAAALGNPGMSSYAALTERARLRRGETVLINGATGASGALAVQIAKYLGAARVIAVGRNPERLAALAALGADRTIPLGQDEAELQAAFERVFAARVDVVLDYLWGRSAEMLLSAAARSAPDAQRIRFVQIGAMSGAEIAVPAQALRAKAIELMGSGLGSVAAPKLLASIAAVLHIAKPAGLKIETETAPLAEVERRWGGGEAGRRLVFMV